jgi:hypothetical protein
MAPSSESSSQTSAAASSPENAPPSASAPQTGAGEGGAEPAAGSQSQASAAEPSQPAASEPASASTTGANEPASASTTGQSGASGSPPPQSGGSEDTGAGSVISVAGITVPDPTDTVGQTIDTVTQTVGAIGSGAPFQDIVPGSGLLDAINGTGILNNAAPITGALGGVTSPTGLIDTATGVIGGLPPDLSGVTSPVSGLVSTAIAAADQTVAAVDHAAGTVANGGSPTGVLDAAGGAAGTLVDTALHNVNAIAGSGGVGDIVGGLGHDLVTGTVAGGGLLAGTPLAGVMGDGALVSGNLLRPDDSSPSSLLQVGAGTDTSRGLLEVTAAGNRDQAESGHIVDTNIGPDNSSGNGVTADLLGATPGGASPTVDADVGQHAGASLVTVNAGNTADQIPIPAIGGIENGGNVNGVLDGVGHDTGSLVDTGLNTVGQATGTGTVGGVVDGLGNNLVDGTVGGTGLLAGTPLAGAQGAGALVNGDVLHADTSSASNLAQVDVGTDQSHGLLGVTAAGNHNPPASNDLVDTNTGPNTPGNGVTAALLGASPDTPSPTVDADAGQHAGSPLVTANTANNADQFQFPALNGAGTDSLVGETGQLPGIAVGDAGGGDVLPLTVQADNIVLSDIGGGALEPGANPTNEGTQVVVHAPLQGALL